jgi:hypothetical protein
MRRIISYIGPVLLLLSLLLGGCSSIKDSPSAVVREFISALQQNNIDLAMTYVDPRYVDRTTVERMATGKWSKRVKDFRVQTGMNDGTNAIVRTYYQQLNQDGTIWIDAGGFGLLRREADGWYVVEGDWL